MSKVIVYSAKGGVAVCYPTGEIPIEQVLVRHCPPGAIVLNKTSLPKDDDFYDAWELNPDNTISVNMEKARNITKNRLRHERKPLLEAQDILFQFALEDGNNTSTIVQEKKRLRNITTLADSCTTLDELRALKC